MFEKSHKMFLFAVSPSFLYALPDMFSFRIASFPSVFFYLGLELGLRLRPGLMFYFVSSSSFSYSPCLWSNHPSTVHLQTWYVLSSELIFLAHCVCLHQQIHYMIPSRFVTHLANPGEYTLLQSTHLSPSTHNGTMQDSRFKTRYTRHKIQGFFARAFVHFVASCFRNFAKAGGGGKVVRTFLCFLCFFFSQV